MSDFYESQADLIAAASPRPVEFVGEIVPGERLGVVAGSTGSTGPLWATSESQIVTIERDTLVDQSAGDIGPALTNIRQCGITVEPTQLDPRAIVKGTKMGETFVLGGGIEEPRVRLARGTTITLVFRTPRG